MYERNYATDPRVLGEEMAKREAYAQEQQIRGTVLGAISGASTAREVPMAESMNRLMQVISAIDDAIMDLDQRTHVMRQFIPAVSPKEARPERSYSPLVGSLNEQISRLERLHICIRQITSELEI
jgi:hypothetical protein